MIYHQVTYNEFYHEKVTKSLYSTELLLHNSILIWYVNVIVSLHSAWSRISRAHILRSLIVIQLRNCSYILIIQQANLYLKGYIISVEVQYFNTYILHIIMILFIIQNVLLNYVTRSKSIPYSNFYCFFRQLSQILIRPNTTDVFFLKA